MSSQSILLDLFFAPSSPFIPSSCLTFIALYHFMTTQIYATVGLNSNPNKFALFGRHDYDLHKTEGFKENLSWISLRRTIHFIISQYCIIFFDIRRCGRMQRTWDTPLLSRRMNALVLILFGKLFASL